MMMITAAGRFNPSMPKLELNQVDFYTITLGVFIALFCLASLTHTKHHDVNEDVLERPKGFVRLDTVRG